VIAAVTDDNDVHLSSDAPVSVTATLASSLVCGNIPGKLSVLINSWVESPTKKL